MEEKNILESEEEEERKTNSLRKGNMDVLKENKVGKKEKMVKEEKEGRTIWEAERKGNIFGKRTRRLKVKKSLGR